MRTNTLSTDQLSTGVETKEDKQQEGESPKRRTAIAEERKRDAYHGGQAKHHAHIDKHMEEEDTQHTVAIDAPELEGLPLGQVDKPQDEREKEQQHTCRPYKALFLAYGAENEVGVLLGHKLQFCLRAVQESLAFKPS